MKYVILSIITGVLLAALIWIKLLSDTSGPAVEEAPPVTTEPGRTSWFPPSCPRELTLQDGTRWAPPAWSYPGCRIILRWSIE